MLQNGLWTSTWAAAMYYGDDTGDAGKASALCVSKTLRGATLRQIIRLSLGGEALRLTLSNEYGQTNLSLGSIRVARATVPGMSDIDAKTDTPVTFGGSERVVLPAGGRVTSDAVDFAASPLQRLAVSMYIEDLPERVACHVGARANSFVARGNGVSDAVLHGADVNTHWFVLCGVDVSMLHTQEAAPLPQALVVLGDSITDGFGVTDEKYTRWVDVLINKLQENPDTRHIAVINMGIGTNQLYGQANPKAAIDRFERDVLGVPGAGYFAFLIGVNDLAFTEVPAGKIIEGYEQMMSKAKASGLKPIGCTILPYAKADPRRTDINAWLRGQCEKGRLCGLFDFDELLRDRQNPDFMLPQYDFDGIHPTAAAYAAMGEYAATILRRKCQK